MKKIIIIAASVMCVVAFLLFMAQECGTGAAYPSYVGTWQSIDPTTRIDSTMTADSGESHVYNWDGETWGYIFGMRMDISFSGDTNTGTVTEVSDDGTNWYSSGIVWDTIINGPLGGQTKLTSTYAVSPTGNYMFTHQVQPDQSVMMWMMTKQ
ncbi:MAG: hypothetical protein JSV25_07100 [Spirochaetota bacterium]|nr:MAG: hypothetical protein JSV25_07100 [Spirochaetota bacterium]